jgi:hypothetical protein
VAGEFAALCEKMSIEMHKYVSEGVSLRRVKAVFTNGAVRRRLGSAARVKRLCIDSERLAVAAA